MPRRPHPVQSLARLGALATFGGLALAAAAGHSGGLQPTPATAFVAGPATTPAEAALAHLDAVGAEVPRRRVRLPVSLRLDESRSAIVGARLGTAADAPPLGLDDGRLGIGLADRARALCAVGAPCVLRLVGHWRGRLDGVGQFEVLQADGVAAAGETETIELEARAAGGAGSSAGRLP